MTEDKRNDRDNRELVYVGVNFILKNKNRLKK